MISIDQYGMVGTLINLSMYQVVSMIRCLIYSIWLEVIMIVSVFSLIYKAVIMRLVWQEKFVNIFVLKLRVSTTVLMCYRLG